MLFFYALLSVISRSDANKECPDWCGDPLVNITLWTDNPNVWRCELPSVSVQTCSDTAFITCLRLDDLGGDLYLMLFPDSPTNIGIDPDYLAKGRVDKLTTTIKCRDGKWTLHESSIRMTHLLCDQYIIDKKKAANSPFKIVGSFLNATTTMPTPETVSDFDDDVEVKDETITEPMATEVIGMSISSFHGTTNIETTTLPPGTDKWTISEEVSTTNQSVNSVLPTRIPETVSPILSTVTSEKTKQVLAVTTSGVTTTPMTTLSMDSLVTERDEVLRKTELKISNSDGDSVAADDVRKIHSRRINPDAAITTTTAKAAVAGTDTPFADLFNDIPSRASLLKTVGNEQMTTESTKSVSHGNRVVKAKFSNLEIPPQIDPYDGGSQWSGNEPKKLFQVKSVKQWKQGKLTKTKGFQRKVAHPKRVVLKMRPLAREQQRRPLKKSKRSRNRRRRNQRAQQRSFRQNNKNS